MPGPGARWPTKIRHLAFSGRHFLEPDDPSVPHRDRRGDPGRQAHASDAGKRPERI